MDRRQRGEELQRQEQQLLQLSRRVARRCVVVKRLARQKEREVEEGAGEQERGLQRAVPQRRLRLPRLQRERGRRGRGSDGRGRAGGGGQAGQLTAVNAAVNRALCILIRWRRSTRAAAAGRCRSRRRRSWSPISTLPLSCSGVMRCPLSAARSMVHCQLLVLPRDDEAEAELPALDQLTVQEDALGQPQRGEGRDGGEGHLARDGRQ